MAKRRTSDRAFLTASQSLQHRLVDAHLAGAPKGALVEPEHLGAKTYQQVPVGDPDVSALPERKRSAR